MAEKGKGKTNKIKRKAGDDDAHVHTAIRRSTVNRREHIGYSRHFLDSSDSVADATRMLREPFKSRVRNASK